MLWSECFFYLYVLRERQRKHRTHGTRGSLDNPPPTALSSVSLISLWLGEFSLSLVGPRGIWKPCGLRTLHISGCNRLRWGGPGLLSQQRTTHHFLLSSLLLGLITESKHSGSVILLVSQGRWFIQFSPPTTSHCSKVLQQKKSEK